MRRSVGCLVLLLSLVMLGCGGDAAVRGVDVAGVISLDGKPLEGVEVFFFTDKFEGYGKTDKDGKYRLVNGAAPGTNKVYLKKFDTQAATGIDSSIPGMDAGQAAAMAEAKAKAMGVAPGVKSPNMIPVEMTDPKTTKLTFPVPEGGTSAADFRLSSSS